MDEKQVAELVKTEDGKEVKSDALDLLLTKNSEHIASIKAKWKPEDDVLTERFNNGYNKATTEILGKNETKLKEHYGVTNNLRGIELVDSIVAEKTKALENKEITDDEVKKSSVYSNMVNTMKTQGEEAVTQVENKYKLEIADFQKEQTFSTISGKADAIINELNPVFSENPVIAQNQRKMIHTALKSKSFEVKDDRIIPIDKDGKVLENEQGHPIDFKSIVTSETTGLFDLKKSKDRSSAGSEEEEEEGGDIAWSGTAPKDDKEYMQMIDNASSKEDKIAITKAYNENN